MFKKNTAVTGFSLGLVSSTDGSDITTGTPVGYYTLDGGTQAAIADTTPVHEGNGLWSFDLLAAEMNGDIVGLTFTHASAITKHFTIKTDTKITSDLVDLAATAIVSGGAIDTTGGAIDTLTTLTNKTGFSLASTGLDAIVSTATGMVEIAKAIWDRVLTGATHNINNSSGKLLRQLKDAGLISDDTAQAGAATTITLAATASAIDDFYAHDGIILTGGTGLGQAKSIQSYNGTTKVATLSAGDAWVVTPDNTTEYSVLYGSLSHVGHLITNALSEINAEVDTALNTAIPGAPTANSINERLAAVDDLTQASGGGDLAAILTDTANMQPKLGTPSADISADIAAVKVDTAATLVDTADMQPKIGAPAADLSADIAAVKVDTAATLVDTAVIGVAGAGLTDLGGMSTGMRAEILAEAVKILTTQMTESYSADGVAPTLAQAIILIQQALTEFAIAGTTTTIKKLDGSTTAATLTLDDATTPTSVTRAT